MSFWETVLAGVVAAVVAGLILRFLRRRKRAAGAGGVKVDGSTLSESPIRTRVSSPHADADDPTTGSVEIEDSRLDKSAIETDVSKP